MSLAGEAPPERLQEELFEVFPSDLGEPLVLGEIFGNENRVEIDFGSGSGRFLIDAGLRFPERNFLGIERLLGRIRKTRRKACQLKLANVRVLRVEIDYAVRYLLPPDSVSRFHLSFPDPWPKRRHHVRRLVDDEFLPAIAAALKREGELWVKTDHSDYFRQIEKMAAFARALFEQKDWEFEYPDTDFDQTFAAENSPIYRLRLRKINRAPR
jgi:tRNA (guanine-N7-)-methyltransferase